MGTKNKNKGGAMIEKKTIEIISDFMENLASLDIQSVEVPYLYIPNWPKEVTIIIKLFKKKFMLPVKDKATNLFTQKKIRRNLTFTIYETGEMEFNFDRWYEQGCHVYCSATRDNYSINEKRIIFLLILRQFQKEVFSKTIKAISLKMEEHNEIIEKAKKALEPFMPFIVADALSE